MALALVVGAVFAALLLSIEDARNAERRARHPQDVLGAANGLELRVLDLETGSVASLSRTKWSFSCDGNRALATRQPEGRALLRLVAGDPAQEARVRKIVAAARSYVDDYSVPVVSAAARVAQGQPPVALHVSSIDDVRDSWKDA